MSNWKLFGWKHELIEERKMKINSYRLLEKVSKKKHGGKMKRFHHLFCHFFHLMEPRRREKVCAIKRPDNKYWFKSHGWKVIIPRSSFSRDDCHEHDVSSIPQEGWMPGRRMAFPHFTGKWSDEVEVLRRWGNVIRPYKTFLVMAPRLRVKICDLPETLEWDHWENFHT